MSNEETITCWACDKSIPKSSLVCPLCDMPITESPDELEDIDSLLDELQNQSSDTSDELPDIPSFGDEISASESADEDMPDIPEFNLEITDEKLESNEDTPICYY